MTGRLGLLALALVPALATGQARTSALRPQLRADLIVGHRPAVQAGAGLELPLGLYVRLGAVAAGGLRTGEVAGSRANGRVDLTGRFLLDPLRQSRYGVSVGGGLSARFEHGERVTPLLLAVIDVERGQRATGWVPAVQLGLGGGTRIGVVVRRARSSGR